MQIESLIAKELIKTMPASIIQRLSDDDEFSSFAGLSHIDYKGIASFDHDSIVKALATPQDSGGPVELAARDGRLFFLTRSSQGWSVSPAENAADVRLIPEFSFLDPDSAVRLEALTQIIPRCWPSLPSAKKWQSILDLRPLSEGELVRLVSDIRATPESYLNDLTRKYSSGIEVDATSFFPKSLTYYEALVGPLANGVGTETWINSVLLPRLKMHLTQSLSGGLRLAFSLNIDSRLCPAGLISSDVSNDDLVLALGELVEARSPLSLLSIIEIAVVRLGEDGRYADLACQALDRLLGEKSKESSRVDAWKLMPTMIRACLRRMSVDEEFWEQQPYWRRLAAFSHAHVLVESLEMDSENADLFIGWIDGLETTEELAATLLDIRREPLWRAWQMTTDLFMAQVVGRLILLRDAVVALGLDFPNAHLLDKAVETMKVERRLLEMEMPGPLNDGFRMRDRKQIRRTDSDQDSKFFSDALADLAHKPTGLAWNMFAQVCRLYFFDDSLLDALSKLPGRFILLEESEERERFFDVLSFAAEIAASQPCEALADSVAASLAREAPKFSRSGEAVAGYSVLIIASGAILDETAWKEWIGRRMADYAYALPKGEACIQLLGNLQALQSQLLIKERPLGRAMKFASSAIA